MTWDPHLTRNRSKVKIRLTCGHWIKTRSVPWGKQKYGCNAGQGCGYQLEWIEAIDEKGRQLYRRIDDNGQPFVETVRRSE